MEAIFIDVGIGIKDVGEDSGEGESSVADMLLLEGSHKTAIDHITDKRDKEADDESIHFKCLHIFLYF